MSRMLPSGACDAHCHVFGPADRFPYAADRTYTPAEATASELRALHRALGFDRAVLVQPACYGYDHAALLDAIETSGGAWRGIALAPPDIPVDTATALDRAGVRGVRVNYLPHLGPPPAPADLVGLAERLAPLGWHLQLHLRAPDLPALLPLIAALPVSIVVDHLARLEVDRGADQSTVDTLLRLLALPNGWLKLSGADRASAGEAPFADVLPIMRLLIAARPERLLWGTDWPHPNIAGPEPDERDLLALFLEAAGGGDAGRVILCDNPQALFGFDEPAVVASTRVS